LTNSDLPKVMNDRAEKISSGQASKHPRIVPLTSSDFDSYVNDGRPVFVDFWAVWCGPCKTMDPVVDRLAARYDGKVVFGKLNVDEQPDVATRYDVLSIPTFMIFRKGRPVDAEIGAVGEAALDRLVQKSLNGSGTHT
jgi:thioredoxin 1